MYSLRPVQPYSVQADLIWCDGTFKPKRHICLSAKTRSMFSPAQKGTTPPPPPRRNYLPLYRRSFFCDEEFSPAHEKVFTAHRRSFVSPTREKIVPPGHEYCTYCQKFNGCPEWDEFSILFTNCSGFLGEISFDFAKLHASCKNLPTWADI
jgi:hypothetical protein